MPVRAEPRLAVVIPAYQAAGTIGRVWSGVRDAVPGAAVWVVDDGSSDGTGNQVPPAHVLRHERNLGKGAALRTGIERALHEGAAVIVTLDADGQHPPGEIPRLLEPLERGIADLVLGARARTGAMPLPRRFTNWLSSILATRVGGGGVDVPDAQTGFRAFTADLARAIRPSETHYDFEAAFLLATLAAKWRVVSIAIPTVYGDSRSHFRTGADTWRMARVFWQYAGRIVSGAR
jgi:glycosyltransferase involved in cell wall biosynthesis